MEREHTINTYKPTYCLLKRFNINATRTNHGIAIVQWVYFLRNALEHIALDCLKVSSKSEIIESKLRQHRMERRESRAKLE